MPAIGAPIAVGPHTDRGPGWVPRDAVQTAVAGAIAQQMARTIKTREKETHGYAEDLEFEQAARVRDRI